MSNHHYFSNLLKKNLWIYFFSFLIAPLAYIGKIAMTGSVSSEDYGVFSAVMSFVIMLGAYNDFGMAESLNFFLPEHIDKKEKHNITQTFSIALVTQILSSSILAIILFFGADFLARYYFEAPLAAPLLHIFILFFFLDNIFRSVSMFFQAVQDTKLQKFIDFIRNLLQIIIIIVISVSTWATIIRYAWAYNIAALGGVLLALLLVYKKYNTYFLRHGWLFWKIDFMRIFRYAIFVMLSANVGTLLSQVDMQMITVMLGTTQAGIYNIYLSIIRIPFVLLLPGVYFLFPVFTDLIKKWDREKVRKIHTFCYEFFAIAAIFMTSFFMIFGDEFTEVLFGPQYALSGKILLYSSPFLIFDFLLQIDFQILSAIGRPRTKMFILLSALWVNLITNYIFLKVFGLVWSALASGIGWIFIWFLAFREVRAYTGSFRWAGFLKNVIGIGIFSWGLLFVHLEAFFSGRMQLFWGVMLISLGYALLFLTLNFTEIRRFMILFRKEKNVW